ncbi:MAG: hypothetical protein V2I43_03275, partial [Parvularcula sp.]|nr:hypothetical protein [Parvularcula sp.]
MAAAPRLLPHHRVVAQHVRDRRALWQKIQLLGRLRLELPAVLDEGRTRPEAADVRSVRRAAAIGGADDQRLAQPVAQRLQLVERGLVDEQLAGAPAGDFGRAEIPPALSVLRCLTPVVEEDCGHGG